MMDIQARKIEFVQKFLNLTNEESIKRLEIYLKEEVESVDFDLKRRVKESEKDFEDGNTFTNEELISKYHD